MYISKLGDKDITYDNVRRLCLERKYVSDTGRKKIIEYLRKREFVTVASSAHVYNVFDKSLSDDYCRIGYSDGVYEWSSEEIFYFDKYNLLLDMDFIQYVLDTERGNEG